MFKIVTILALLIIGGIYSLYSVWLAVHPKDTEITKVYASRTILPDEYVQNIRELCIHKDSRVRTLSACDRNLKKESMVAK